MQSAGTRFRRSDTGLAAFPHALDLDVSSAVLGKLQTNEYRYPVDELRIPPQVGRFRRPEREKDRLEAD